MTDMWAMVAAERGALADDLAGLTDEQWATPSLDDGWSVRDVVAHLCAAADQNVPRFFVNFARSGFNFDKFANVQIGKRLGDRPADTLERFRSLQGSTTSPPGPKTTWLGEVLVHSEDIRRPLGIAHDYPIEAVRQVADFYKGSNTLIGSKSRIAGLQLKATDTDWSHGEGAAVEGPLMAVVMAMTGRTSACDNLTGAGVDRLRGSG
ncbi:MAG: hypothetical protein JWR35_2469 [Marmoricola sp.]|jgi:uncharacterized protein (TIGR03083 family)|nr:hypothetical protein [Marmoricola sp.]